MSSDSLKSPFEIPESFVRALTQADLDDVLAQMANSREEVDAAIKAVDDKVGRGIPFSMLGIANYDSTKTYATNNFVLVGNTIYISLQDANTGNDPLKSATWWQQTTLIGVLGVLIANVWAQRLS